MKREGGWIGVVGLVLLLLVVAAGIIAVIYSAVYWGTNKHNVSFTVNKSERVCDSSSGSSSDCKYLIYTTSGVYEDTDSFLNNKFNSSDLYNQLENGKNYTCQAVGFRNQYWSNYENLISCNQTN